MIVQTATEGKDEEEVRSQVGAVANTTRDETKRACARFKLSAIGRVPPTPAVGLLRGGSSRGKQLDACEQRTHVAHM